MMSAIAGPTTTRRDAGAPDPRWVRRYRPRPDAASRIVCFPPAGGTASAFRGWAPRLPDDVELWAMTYPGRENRFAEPSIEDMAELADAAASALAPAIDRPCLLFGHSMGASVAFEVARRLERACRGLLVRLVVSCRPGPALQLACPSRSHLLDDDGLFAELRELGGTPGEILDDPEMRALVLPIARIDYELIGRYRPRLEPPLRAPISAFVSEHDPSLLPDDVLGWGRATRGDFDVVRFPGGHFYLLEQEADVVRDVVARLTPHLQGSTCP